MVLTKIDPGCLLSDPVREQPAARLQTAVGTIHIAIDTNLYMRLRPMAVGQKKENDAIGALWRVDEGWRMWSLTQSA
jgi:hypothetical protein